MHLYSTSNKNLGCKISTVSLEDICRIISIIARCPLFSIFNALILVKVLSCRSHRFSSCIILNRKRSCVRKHCCQFSRIRIFFFLQILFNCFILRSIFIDVKEVVKRILLFSQFFRRDTNSAEQERPSAQQFSSGLPDTLYPGTPKIHPEFPLVGTRR